MNNILNIINKKETKTTGIWFLRQSGRYLPEYLAIRSKWDDFLAMCKDSATCRDLALIPMKKFDLDCAIIFCDILTIPNALGYKVEFNKNIEIKPELDLTNYFQKKVNDVLDEMNFVYETVKLTRASLDKNRDLIGFCGSALTLALYMLSGGSHDKFFFIARSKIASNPKEFESFIYYLADIIIGYLVRQSKAGADILQLFESSSSFVSNYDYQKFVIEPTRYIVSKVKKHTKAPIIGYVKNYPHVYVKKTGVDVIGISENIDIRQLNKILDDDIVVQGNLDPSLLLHDNPMLKKEVEYILDVFKHRPFIFNVGSGINKFSDENLVKKTISIIRSK